MKKRILFALAAVLVFGLAAVVFAYNNHSQNHPVAASHCDMHKQKGSTATGEHKDSCCGMADCCKDGKCSMGGACCGKKDKDSCPMKQKNAETTSSVDMTNVVVVGETDGENCCQPGADCCKGGRAVTRKKVKL